eukprot:SAG31_NODE_6891_length_1859_cov_0.990341_2_plen_83_part_01
MDTITAYVSSKHTEISISTANSVLETVFLEPVQDQLFEILQTQHAPEAQLLQLKRIALDTKPQSHFQVPAKLISPDDWKSATT